MGFAADDDRDRRRAKQSVRLDVPPGAREDDVARRGQRGDVRDGGPGDESAGAIARQAEQLQHPLERDFLEDGGRRRDVVEPGVLIPRAGKPIRGERRRQRPADDEAVKPWTGNADRRRRANLVQLAQHQLPCDRLDIQRDVERRQAGHRRRIRSDRAILQALEICGRPVGGGS